MDIDNMQAGRELDALIAEKVMGWKKWRVRDKDERGDIRFEYDMTVPRQYDGSNLQHLDMIVPYYSTNIADAWQVIDELCREYYIKLEFESGEWFCTIYRGDRSIAKSVELTAPLAICRAALKAVA